MVLVRTTVPFRPQIEARDCGAAALGMILAYFGRHVALHELRAACLVNREGVGVLSIVNAARRYGLHAKAIRREHLAGVVLPAVIFWNFNHFLVLEKVNADSIVVQDPAYGQRILPNDLVQHCFSGIVLTFAPTDTFAAGGEPPLVIPAELYTPASQAFVVVAVLRIIPELVLIIAIYAGFIGQLLHLELAAVWSVYGVLSLATRFMIERQYQQQDLFAHLLSLSPAFFTRYYTRELADRVSHSDATRVHLRLLEQFAASVRAGLLAGALLIVNPVVLPILSIPLGMGWLSMRIAHSNRQHAAQNDYWQQRFHALSHQTLIGIESLKLHGREQQAQVSMTQAANRAFSASFPRGWEARAAMVFIAPVLLLFACAVLVEARQIEPPAGIAAFSMLLLMVHHLNHAATIGETLRHLRLLLLKREDVLRESPPSVSPATDRLALKNVSFGYTEALAVADVTLEVLAGACTGIVGRSGSGKSTLVALLAGHLTPRQGIALLHRSCAVANGRPLILNGTVRDNVRLFDMAVSDTHVMDALRDACLDDLIPHLDDVIAVDSAALSPSQLQRLDIARSLSRYPEVMILDEATSVLDVLTEARLLENLKRRGCRCVIVSHRLSALRDCDEILVIETGRIVQRGSHAELAAQSGLYTTLMVEGALL